MNSNLQQVQLSSPLEDINSLLPAQNNERNDLSSNACKECDDQMNELQEKLQISKKNLMVLPIFQNQEQFFINQSFKDNEHGLICWDATLVAIKYLELLVKYVPGIFRGKYILELGAGTGAVGIALCKFLSRASIEFERIVSTDKQVCIPLMEVNRQMNLNDVARESFDRMEVCELLWEDVNSYLSKSPLHAQYSDMKFVDILIICDCIYENVSIWSSVLSCALRLMNSESKLLIVQERRGKKDAIFFSVAHLIFEIVPVPREQQDDCYSSDDIEIYWMKLNDNSMEALKMISIPEFISTKIALATKKLEIQNSKDVNESTKENT